uniref:MDS1 and EVI1 complex locus n=1 Tax=Sinocyclocheilus grahami TaxID=75366 RepID=A0A672KLZ3_SINGR
NYTLGEKFGGVSDADPVPLATANDLPSPGLSGDALSPVDQSPFYPSFHTSVYLAGDGVESVPPDFEVRESAITRGTLGIWSRRRLEVGERLGPYEETSRLSKYVQKISHAYSLHQTGVVHNSGVI